MATATVNKTHLAHQSFDWAPGARMEILDAQRGVVEAQPRRRKVAIIGAGYYKEEAPYDDPEWEVWALNVCGAWDRQGRMRADRWFELHQACAQSADDMAWISRCPVPIYLPEDFAAPFLGGTTGTVTIDTRNSEGRPVPGPSDPEEEGPVGDGGVPWTGTIPNAVVFPVRRLEAQFGGYWACTFAYQMALARAEGFTDVGLYGVELPWGTRRERTVEWANVAWWAGFLEGQGVNIHLPQRSSIGGHPHRYGLEYDAEIAAVDRYLAATGQFPRSREATKVEGMGG